MGLIGISLAHGRNRVSGVPGARSAPERTQEAPIICFVRVAPRGVLWHVDRCGCVLDLCEAWCAPALGEPFSLKVRRGVACPAVGKIACSSRRRAQVVHRMHLPCAPSLIGRVPPSFSLSLDRVIQEASSSWHELRWSPSRHVGSDRCQEDLDSDEEQVARPPFGGADAEAADVASFYRRSARRCVARPRVSACERCVKVAIPYGGGHVGPKLKLGRGRGPWLCRSRT